MEIIIGNAIDTHIAHISEYSRLRHRMRLLGGDYYSATVN